MADAGGSRDGDGEMLVKGYDVPPAHPQHSDEG